MQTINMHRPGDTTLSSSAQHLATEQPLRVVAEIANAHPGQHLDAARFTYLLAARHTCDRCGQPAIGRIGLAWLCQKCKEMTE